MLIKDDGKWVIELIKEEERKICISLVYNGGNYGRYI